MAKLTLQQINRNGKKRGERMIPRQHRPITKLGKEGIEEQHKAKRSLAGLNKDRAYRMEKKVAEFFGENGNRVPMSGAAGAWKGDVVVELKNNPGKMLIECKLSAAFNNSRQSPQIRLVFGWLTKLLEDVKTTGAKWGILIIHYFKKKEFYVVTRSEDLLLLRDRYNIQESAIVGQMLALPVVHDWCIKRNGVPRTGFNIIQSELQEILTPVGLFHATRVLTPYGEYVIMPLSNYRELMGEI